MLLTVGKELKQNLKDHLRGVRHVVRLLGSDDERQRLARPALPAAPFELDRVIGRTFRAVDEIMTAVETAATPFRSSHSAAPGFRPAAHYVGEGDLVAADARERFVDDLYRVLKVVASTAGTNPLIRTAPLADIHADLISRHRGMGDPTGDQGAAVCATLFLALARRRPLADPRAPGEEAAIRQYAAVSLIFGLTSIRGYPSSEVPAMVADALLLSGARLEAFADAAKADSETEQLKGVLESLLIHLA